MNIELKPADKRLLHEVSKIAKAKDDKPVELDELKAQIKILARAVGEVAAHCASLNNALQTIAKNVQFTAKQ